MQFFRIGMGGKIGNGEQFMSFIHMEDLVGIILFLLLNRKDGIFNVTSPQPVKNKQFTKILGKLLKRPVYFSIPSEIIRLLYGKGSVVILEGQYVIPENLLRNGYIFKYSSCEEVLKEMLG